jgi:hypothetical protein
MVSTVDAVLGPCMRVCCDPVPLVQSQSLPSEAQHHSALGLKRKLLQRLNQIMLGFVSSYMYNGPTWRILTCRDKITSLLYMTGTPVWCDDGWCIEDVCSWSSGDRVTLSEKMKASPVCLVDKLLERF